MFCPTVTASTRLLPHCGGSSVNTIPLFVGLSAPGMGEWAVILVLVLVLFGGKNIPDLARALGKGIREFKRAANGIGDDEPPARPAVPHNESPENK